MNLSKHEKICLHCGGCFFPNLRNRARQDYCYKPECRKARKNLSQRLWRANNPDYFKGASNVAHVRQWRARNPGYWRRRKFTPPVTPHSTVEPLQDGVPSLQDVLTLNPLILGILRRICGLTLQDSVEKVIHDLILEGLEIRALIQRGKPISRKPARE